jgi:hypothetical protein
VNPLAEARERVIQACDGLDSSPTERSWIDPDDVRLLLRAFTREDVKMLRESQIWADSTDLRVNGEPADFEDLADRIEALLPPEEK